MSQPARAIPPSHPQLETAKQHLGELISFDTVSKNSNRALIDHMAVQFGRLGAEITFLPDATGEKVNLVARFGPEGQPGVVLSGHTDVVPAEEDTWLTPPFVMQERDGRLYGRGACDMKGFAACVMAAAPAIAAADLQRPLYLCFSYDEEVGCLGAPDIARHLAALPVPPEFAIIGEPSEMKLVTGQKGKIAMRATVTGTSGHSSFSPRHVNAVEYAGRVLQLITKRAAAYETEGPFDREFTVPHATLLATMISGGVATNVTPDHCSFTFELRSIGENDPEGEMAALIESAGEINAEMQQRAPGCGIAFSRIFAYPAMNDARNSAGFRTLADLMPEYGGKVSYGSEGGVFEQIGGIPSVIVGPGSIEQAHKPNEFVEINQIENCLEFLDGLTARLSGA
jgi:acetylornithine deacetylase